jgi:uncharacterized integral membrane protein
MASGGESRLFFCPAFACARRGQSGKVTRMRLLALIILCLFVAVGVLVGALNAQWVDYDLAFVQWRVPKGAALLGALVIGWALGGLTAWLGTTTAARRRARQASRTTGKKAATGP